MMKHIWPQCYIEISNNGLWFIAYPDGSMAYGKYFRTMGWARRMLKRLIREEKNE